MTNKLTITGNPTDRFVYTGATVTIGGRIEEMKRHTFTDHGGQAAKNGNPMWPDYLELIMDKRRAFDFVQSVLRQLADDEDKIVVTIVGKMEMDTKG